MSGSEASPAEQPASPAVAPAASAESAPTPSPSPSPAVSTAPPSPPLSFDSRGAESDFPFAGVGSVPGFAEEGGAAASGGKDLGEDPSVLALGFTLLFPLPPFFFASICLDVETGGRK